MVRFNDKPQIANNEISVDDILPITDMDAQENDKKITIGQLKSFISGDGSEKANVDFTNTKMITDSIISAPNGIFEASNNNQAITVKSELQLVFANGRDDATGRYAITEHVTSQNITQSILTLSDGIYELFLTNNDTILFIDQDSVYVSEDAPQIIEENAYWYNLIDNYWKATSNYGQTWTTANIASLGTVEIADNRVVSIKPNQLLGIISFEVFKKMTQQEQRPGALEICDIGTALYVDESKGLRRYLNGSILNINNNTKAFVERLKEIRITNPDYFTTEEDWQNEATENIDGCVYKFVIDEENGIVRLPKYPEYIEINEIGIGGTIPVVGNGMTLGLTNGADNFGLAQWAGQYNYATGLKDQYDKALTNTGISSAQFITGNIGLTTDSTKSGIVADASEAISTKQTRLKLKYFIQISTGVETKANIINQIQLNNPVTIFESKWSDHILNNLSWLRADTFSWQSGDVYVTAYNKLVEEYATGTEETEGSITFKQTDNDFKIADISQEQAIIDKYNTDDIAWFYILDTANRRFKLPRMKRTYYLKDIKAFGYPKYENATDLIKQDGIAPSNGYLVVRQSTNVGTNLTVNGFVFPFEGSYYNSEQQLIPVSKGDSYSSTAWANMSLFKFIPLKDTLDFKDEGFYLYFYVGETVQNAKLIDIGRTNEILNNKIDTASLRDVSIVVETYIDPDTPTNGYRIWSDGYCEQWGRSESSVNLMTVSLLKKYKDINYNITTALNPIDSRSSYANEVPFVNNTTVDSFKIWTMTNTYANGSYWKTSGYLAEGEY